MTHKFKGGVQLYSLKTRLIISLAASLALFFLIQTLIIGSEVRALSEQNIHSRLEHDQKELLAALSWAPPAEPVLDPARIPGIYQRPFSGHYFQISIGGYQLRSRSLWDEQLLPVREKISDDIPGPAHQRLLMISQDFVILNHPAQIRIAEDVSGIRSNTASFQKSLLLFAAVGLMLLLILQGTIIRYGLAPLQRIRDQLRQLEKGEIEQVTTPAPSEIMPLVEEINQLLQLLRNRLMRSRHALGDLAHAMKTPIAIMGQIIERHPEPEDKALMKQQLQYVEQRIHGELARARTAGRTPGGYWSDPQRDIHDLTQMMMQIFPHIKFSLRLSDDLNIAADREDMLEVFGNLLENAGKWARSQVECSLIKKSHALMICIEDDGPGIDESQFKSLLLRGNRADESKPGHGLGLAIVHDIIVAYEGELELARSKTLQGLKVSMILPQP